MSTVSRSRRSSQPTPWEQERASQLRTLIADSRNAPTPAVGLLNDGAPNDWLVRAAALWRVSQECEELAGWWTDSGQQALPLWEAVRAIRQAIPHRVNLAVVDAQLGHQTGLQKSNADKDFHPRYEQRWSRRSGRSRPRARCWPASTRSSS
jgi:hypothetical protein